MFQWGHSVNHTFSYNLSPFFQWIWKEICKLPVWLRQLQFRYFALMFLWQWRRNSLAPNESRGGLIGTLAIHALVLPWRDGTRNPTHLREKGNVSRKLIQIWGPGVERCLVVFLSLFSLKLNLAFLTMLFSIISKGINSFFWRDLTVTPIQSDWHVKETVKDSLNRNTSQIFKVKMALLWSTCFCHLHPQKNVSNCFIFITL